ncbi:MAG: glutathione peroxidase [Wenzhouxiangella sp.]
MNIFNYHFTGLRGETLRLERFRNQPILLVNTASECGFTPHYTKLQRIYNDYNQSGLVVIAVPCNDFGEQEPGTEEEIANFLETEYQVTFPVTAKQSVIGRGIHALYRDLLEQYGTDILPRWNFHKYLFDRKGELVEHWPGEVPPDDSAVIHQITRNLQSWSL